MADKILIKRSAVPGKVPTGAQLAAGELAINTADGRLYLKKDDGTVIHLGAARAWTETTTSTNKTLVPFERCLVTSPELTITLPLAPSTGDEVAIAVGNFTTTAIAGNGQQITGQAGPAVINREYVTVHLFYTGSDWRFA